MQAVKSLGVLILINIFLLCFLLGTDTLWNDV